MSELKEAFQIILDELDQMDDKVNNFEQDQTNTNESIISVLNELSERIAVLESDK